MVRGRSFDAYINFVLVPFDILDVLLGTINRYENKANLSIIHY